MKKIIHLLVQGNQKPIWQKEKTHLSSVNNGKGLPLLELPLSWSPHKMKQLKKQNLLKWD
jgi:hypothetical protein